MLGAPTPCSSRRCRPPHPLHGCAVPHHSPSRRICSHTATGMGHEGFPAVSPQQRLLRPQRALLVQPQHCHQLRLRLRLGLAVDRSRGSRSGPACAQLLLQLQLVQLLLQDSCVEPGGDAGVLHASARLQVRRLQHNRARGHRGQGHRISKLPLAGQAQPDAAHRGSMQWSSTVAVQSGKQPTCSQPMCHQLAENDAELAASKAIEVAAAAAAQQRAQGGRKTHTKNSPPSCPGAASLAG